MGIPNSHTNEHVEMFVIIDAMVLCFLSVIAFNILRVWFCYLVCVCCLLYFFNCWYVHCF